MQIKLFGRNTRSSENISVLEHQVNEFIIKKNVRDITMQSFSYLENEVPGSYTMIMVHYQQ